MKQTFVLLWRPDKRMIQAIAITFMPEYHLIYETSPRCREWRRLNDCSIFALRGLCAGRCSRARNKLKSHRGKKKKSLREKHCCYCATCAKVWGEVRKEEKDRPEQEAGRCSD